jgi:hypothetical protein
MNYPNIWIPGAMPFFLFGLLYYLISPVLVLPLLSRENDLLIAATGHLVDSHFDSSYALDVLVIFLSFYLGY